MNRLLKITLFIVFAGLISADSLHAGTNRYWLASVDSDFGNAANWWPSDDPPAFVDGDSLLINVDGNIEGYRTATISADIQTVFQSIYIGLVGGPASVEQTGGAVSLTNEFIVGCDGGPGTYLMTGGSLTKTTSSQSAWIGLRKTGTMEMSGGATFNVAGGRYAGGIFVGSGIGGNGTLTVSDAFFNSTGPVFIGFEGATGAMTLNGNSAATATNDLLIGYYAGHGSLTINDNATFDNSNAGCPRGTKIGGDGVGELNLNGGSFTTVSIGGNANGTVNFNGGVLKAVGDSTDWLGASLHYNVMANGAIFDITPYVNVQVNGSLAEHTTSLGGGLVKNGAGTLTLAGVNTYTGMTTINGGTLALVASSALPGSVTVNPDTTLALVGTVSLSGKIIGTSGKVSIESGSAVTLGNNPFTGTVQINGGALNLAGTHGGDLVVNNGASWYHNGTGTVSGTVTVGGDGFDSTNALLGGTGTLGNVSVLSNMNPGSGVKSGIEAGQNGIGSLHVAGLNFTGSSFVYVGNSTLGINAYTGSNAAIFASGALSIGSTYGEMVQFDLGNANIASGIYHLIQHAGTIEFQNGGSMANLGIVNAILSARQTASLVDNVVSGNLHSLDYVVTGSFPIWTGLVGTATNNNWVAANTSVTNWKSSTDSATAFSFINGSSSTIGDAVLFNDAAGSAHSNVTIDEAVAPSSVTVDNTMPYTFSGSGSIIDGSTKTTLLKKNTGMLVINTANSFSGGTTIFNGTIQTGNASALGTDGVKFAPDAGVTAKLQLNGFSINLGGLSTDLLSLGTSIIENGSSTDATLTIANMAANTFSGQLQDGGTGKLKVDFTNSAKFTLGGVCTYSGDTMLSGSEDVLIGTDDALPHGVGKGNVVFFGGRLDLNGHNVTVNSLVTDSAWTSISNNVSGTTKTLTVGDADASFSFIGSFFDANTPGTGKLALRKIGTGTLAINDPGQDLSSNYSGGTTLSEGIIQTGYTYALGTGVLSMESGTVLDIQSNNLYVYGLAGTGSVTTTVDYNYVDLYLLPAATTNAVFDGLIECGSNEVINLKVNGAGIQTLNGLNTYTGTTSLASTMGSPTLVVAHLADGGLASSIGQSSSDSSNLVFNGGILHYTGPNTSIDRGFQVIGGSAGIITDNDLTITGNIDSTTGNLSKAGAGTLTFANPSAEHENVLCTQFLVNGGSVVFASGIYKSQSMYVGLEDGPASITQNGGSIYFERELIVGCDGGPGTYHMTGGTLTKTVFNNSAWVGLRNTGSLEVSNGAVFTLAGGDYAGGIFVGSGGQGNGQLTVNNAVMNSDGPIFIGFDGGTGEVAFTNSATVTVNNDLLIGYYPGHGSLTISENATLECLNATCPRGTQVGGDGTGELNLNGGTFTTVSIGGNANGTVNFNGGVLKAAQDIPDWLNKNIAFKVQTGGAIFDTNGKIVTAQAVLTHGGIATETDGGIKKVGDGSLTLTGALSYNGDTIVNQGALTVTSAINTPNATVYVTSNATLTASSIVANTLAIGGSPVVDSIVVNAAAVPEPGTLLLLSLAGMIALLAWRRR